MVTKDPDLSHLNWSIERLRQQDHPVKELIVVDSSSPKLSVEADDLPVRVIHQPDAGIGEARHVGIQQAQSKYIVEMDEDAIFLNDDYLSDAVGRVESSRHVTAAGGVALPLRGNIEGRLWSVADRLNPSTLSTHYMVFPRAVCTSGREQRCYTVSARGEDIKVRDRLNDAGRIVRMYDQPVLKDMPTDRQASTRNAITAALIGGIISGIGANIADRFVRRTLTEVEDELEN